MLKKITKRTVKVGEKEYEVSLWQSMGGWNYEVYGPISKISGWVNGDMKDAMDEAKEHANEKFPK